LHGASSDLAAQYGTSSDRVMANGLDPVAVGSLLGLLRRSDASTTWSLLGEKHEVPVGLVLRADKVTEQETRRVRARQSGRAARVDE